MVATRAQLGLVTPWPPVLPPPPRPTTSSKVCADYHSSVSRLETLAGRKFEDEQLCSGSCNILSNVRRVHWTIPEALRRYCDMVIYVKLEILCPTPGEHSGKTRTDVKPTRWSSHRINEAIIAWINLDMNHEECKYVTRAGRCLV